MLESKEQLDTCVTLAGEWLYFPRFKIRAIPGHLVYNVQSFDSVYDMEKQDFDFQILHTDFLCNEIAENDEFVYKLNGREYTFKILACIEDLINWVQLKTSFVSSDKV
jgi:hypothetical protein